MKRFYDCIETVIPRKDWMHEGCPLDRENCYECEYHGRGGTLGGKVWIECNYDDKNDGREETETRE
jgi:hypothetical protein